MHVDKQAPDEDETGKRESLEGERITFGPEESDRDPRLQSQILVLGNG